jgi:hypothetical protein
MQCPLCGKELTETSENIRTSSSVYTLPTYEPFARYACKCGFIAKEIIYCMQRAVLACDAKCSKAWGINGRKKKQLSDDPDDYEFFSDAELGRAPKDPGTYEGGQGKPWTKEERLNKWCCRECERSDMARTFEELKLTDYSKRRKNMGG